MRKLRATGLLAAPFFGRPAGRGRGSSPIGTLTRSQRHADRRRIFRNLYRVDQHILNVLMIGNCKRPHHVCHPLKTISAIWQAAIFFGCGYRLSGSPLLHRMRHRLCRRWQPPVGHDSGS